jgi:hypothetical protein
VHVSTYDEEDLEIPYIFLSHFLAYLRDLWSSGKLRVDDPRAKALFSHIEELEGSGVPENMDFVTTGFFESMLHGDFSDQFFVDAAARYLSPGLYDQFRFVRSGRAGSLQEFLKHEGEMDKNNGDEKK